jgi:hypothetical protein
MQRLKLHSPVFALCEEDHPCLQDFHFVRHCQRETRRGAPSYPSEAHRRSGGLSVGAGISPTSQKHEVPRDFR